MAMLSSGLDLVCVCWSVSPGASSGMAAYSCGSAYARGEFRTFVVLPLLLVSPRIESITTPPEI